MGELKIVVVKATHLADKDLMGKTDPYVILELEQDNMVRFYVTSCDAQESSLIGFGVMDRFFYLSFCRLFVLCCLISIIESTLVHLPFTVSLPMTVITATAALLHQIKNH